MPFSLEAYTSGLDPQITANDNDRITVLESDVTNPTGLVTKNDAVVFNTGVGFALETAAAATSRIVIVTRGIVSVPVLGTVADGNEAVAIHDAVFINATTAVVSKEPAGIPYGMALNTVAAGATTNINVALWGLGGGGAGSVAGPQTMDSTLVGNQLITNAVNMLTGFTFGRPVKVQSWNLIVNVLTTGAGLITFEKATVDLTETMVIPTASAVGTVITTPITTVGEEDFTATAVLDVESDGVPTTGEVTIFARVINV